jgi:hypothetical protein
MRITEPDFFFKDPIDFEHKKWLLYSFIKEIEDDFNLYKLYPSIEQVKFNISNLEKWKYSKELYSLKKVKGIDFERLTLLYDMEDESKEIKEIDKIVNFSILNLNDVFNKGKEIFRKIETSLIWNTIGLIPEYRSEGYLLIQIDKWINIFKYKIFLDFIDIDFLTRKEISLYNTSNNIKLNLIKDYKELPNPMVFEIKTDDYPLEDSIIPIIKKVLKGKL